MSKVKLMLIGLVLSAFLIPNSAFAQQATAEEVVAKVRAAADFLATNGKSGLDFFNTKKSQYVWKDTYVWVLKCEEFTAAAHAFAPKFVGRDSSDLVDKKGNYFIMQMCDESEVAANKGVWTEYWWPKKGQDAPARKVAYTLQVNGQPYQVSAGIYSPSITAAELNKKLK